jgi:hypothetical protein
MINDHDFLNILPSTSFASAAAAAAARGILLVYLILTTELLNYL